MAPQKVYIDLTDNREALYSVNIVHLTLALRWRFVQEVVNRYELTRGDLTSMGMPGKGLHFFKMIFFSNNDFT